MVTVGFHRLGLERLAAACIVGNLPSAATAERLGFKLEGTLRSAARVETGRADVRVYGLLKSEWEG